MFQRRKNSKQFDQLYFKSNNFCVSNVPTFSVLFFKKKIYLVVGGFGGLCIISPRSLGDPHIIENMSHQSYRRQHFVAHKVCSIPQHYSIGFLQSRIIAKSVFLTNTHAISVQKALQRSMTKTKTGELLEVTKEKYSPQLGCHWLAL